MEELTAFKNGEFGEIRAIGFKGEPWYVGKDVAAALGYKDLIGAIQSHVGVGDKMNSRELLKGESPLSFLGDKLDRASLLGLGPRGGWLINESGLESLALSSRLPRAMEFRRWVAQEVTPRIRKHGADITP